MEQQGIVPRLAKEHQEGFLRIADSIIDRAEDMGMKIANETFDSFSKDLMKFIGKHFEFVTSDGEH